MRMNDQQFLKSTVSFAMIFLMVFTDIFTGIVPAYAEQIHISEARPRDEGIIYDGGVIYGYGPGCGGSGASTARFYSIWERAEIQTQMHFYTVPRLNGSGHQTGSFIPGYCIEPGQKNGTLEGTINYIGNSSTWNKFTEEQKLTTERILLYGYRVSMDGREWFLNQPLSDTNYTKYAAYVATQILIWEVVEKMRLNISGYNESYTPPPGAPRSQTYAYFTSVIQGKPAYPAYVNLIGAMSDHERKPAYTYHTYQEATLHKANLNYKEGRYNLDFQDNGMDGDLLQMGDFSEIKVTYNLEGSQNSIKYTGFAVDVNQDGWYEYQDGIYDHIGNFRASVIINNGNRGGSTENQNLGLTIDFGSVKPRNIIVELVKPIKGIEAQNPTGICYWSNPGNAKLQERVSEAPISPLTFYIAVDTAVLPGSYEDVRVILEPDFDYPIFEFEGLKEDTEGGFDGERDTPRGDAALEAIFAGDWSIDTDMQSGYFEMKADYNGKGASEAIQPWLTNGDLNSDFTYDRLGQVIGIRREGVFYSSIREVPPEGYLSEIESESGTGIRNYEVTYSGQTIRRETDIVYPILMDTQEYEWSEEDDSYIKFLQYCESNGVDASSLPDPASVGEEGFYYAGASNAWHDVEYELDGGYDGLRTYTGSRAQKCYESCDCGEYVTQDSDPIRVHAWKVEDFTYQVAAPEARHEANALTYYNRVIKGMYHLTKNRIDSSLCPFEGAEGSNPNEGKGMAGIPWSLELVSDASNAEDHNYAVLVQIKPNEPGYVIGGGCYRVITGSNRSHSSSGTINSILNSDVFPNENDFFLADQNNKQLLTGKGGDLYIYDIPTGSYKLSELPCESNTGYVMETSYFTIEKEDDQGRNMDYLVNYFDKNGEESGINVIHESITNYVIRNEVEVVKKDSETGKTVPSDQTAFRIRYLGLPGAESGIYDPNMLCSACQRPMEEHRGGYLINPQNNKGEGYEYVFYSDKNGTISLPYQLEYGAYQIEEITAPKGYFIGRYDEQGNAESAQGDYDYFLSVPFALYNQSGQKVTWSTQIDYENGRIDDSELVYNYYPFIVERQEDREEGNPLPPYRIVVEMRNNSVKGNIEVSKVADVLAGFRKRDSEYGDLYQPVYEQQAIPGISFDIIAAEDITYEDGLEVPAIFDNRDQEVLLELIESNHIQFPDAVRTYFKKLEDGTEVFHIAEVDEDFEDSEHSKNMVYTKLITSVERGTQYFLEFDEIVESTMYGHYKNHYKYLFDLEYAAGGSHITDLHMEKTTTFDRYTGYFPPSELPRFYKGRDHTYLEIGLQEHQFIDGSIVTEWEQLNQIESLKAEYIPDGYGGQVTLYNDDYTIVEPEVYKPVMVSVQEAYYQDYDINGTKKELTHPEDLTREQAAACLATKTAYWDLCFPNYMIISDGENYEIAVSNYRMDPETGQEYLVQISFVALEEVFLNFDKIKNYMNLMRVSGNAPKGLQLFAIDQNHTSTSLKSDEMGVFFKDEVGEVYIVTEDGNGSYHGTINKKDRYGNSVTSFETGSNIQIATDFHIYGMVPIFEYQGEGLYTNQPEVPQGYIMDEINTDTMFIIMSEYNKIDTNGDGRADIKDYKIYTKRKNGEFQYIPCDQTGESYNIRTQSISFSLIQHKGSKDDFKLTGFKEYNQEEEEAFHFKTMIDGELEWVKTDFINPYQTGSAVNGRNETTHIKDLMLELSEGIGSEESGDLFHKTILTRQSPKQAYLKLGDDIQIALVSSGAFTKTEIKVPLESDLPEILIGNQFIDYTYALESGKELSPLNPEVEYLVDLNGNYIRSKLVSQKQSVTEDGTISIIPGYRLVEIISDVRSETEAIKVFYPDGRVSYTDIIPMAGSNGSRGMLILEAETKTLKSAIGRIVETITTGKDGIALSSPLPLGNYYIRERDSKDISNNLPGSLVGLVGSPNIYRAELVYEGQYIPLVWSSATIENQAVRIQMDLRKGFQKEHGEDHYIPKAGAVFGVFAYDNEITGKDNIGSVAIDQLNLAEGDMTAIITTDEKGKALESLQLPFGTYYVKEISTLDGYVINNQRFLFRIDETTNSDSLIFEMHQDGIEGKVNFVGLNTTEVSIYTKYQIPALSVMINGETFDTQVPFHQTGEQVEIKNSVDLARSTMTLTVKKGLPAMIVFANGAGLQIISCEDAYQVKFTNPPDGIWSQKDDFDSALPYSFDIGTAANISYDPIVQLASYTQQIAFTGYAAQLEMPYAAPQETLCHTDGSKVELVMDSSGNRKAVLSIPKGMDLPEMIEDGNLPSWLSYSQNNKWWNQIFIDVEALEVGQVEKVISGDEKQNILNVGKLADGSMIHASSSSQPIAKNKEEEEVEGYQQDGITIVKDFNEVTLYQKELIAVLFAEGKAAGIQAHVKQGNYRADIAAITGGAVRVLYGMEDITDQMDSGLSIYRGDHIVASMTDGSIYQIELDMAGTLFMEVTGIVNGAMASGQDAPHIAFHGSERELQDQAGMAIVQKFPLDVRTYEGISLKYSQNVTYARSDNFVRHLLVKLNFVGTEPIPTGIIHNKKIPIVKISKVDIRNNRHLSNAVIEIRDTDGTIVFTGKTDEKGKVYFEPLMAGRYTYTETASPDGYLINKTEFSFEIQSNGYIIGEDTIQDEPTPVVMLHKKDFSTGKALEGAQLTIYDMEGNMIRQGITNSEGDMAFKPLFAGTYQFRETKAPNGYLLNSTLYTFIIHEDGRISGVTTITNHKKDQPGEPEVPEKPGKKFITLTKRDLVNNQLLAGAEIAIYDQAGKEIYRGITGESGKISFEISISGTYTFVELKAPEGYIGSEEIFTFTVYKNGSITGDHTIYNEPLTGLITASYSSGYGGGGKQNIVKEGKISLITKVPKTNDLTVSWYLYIYISGMLISISCIILLFSKRKKRFSVFAIYLLLVPFIPSLKGEAAKEEALEVVTKEEEYTTDKMEDLHHGFEETVELEGHTYKLSGVTYKVKSNVPEATDEPKTEVHQITVASAPFVHLEDQVLPENTYEDENGVIYHLKESITESKTLPDQKYPMEVEIVYEMLESGSEIPAMGEIEITDQITEETYIKRIPHTSYEYRNERWVYDFEFPITFHMYGADQYLLGEKKIEYNEDIPLLLGYEKDLLHLIGLHPDHYSVDQFRWNGEMYQGEGELCRDAVASGSKRIVDCAAIYRWEELRPGQDVYITYSTYENISEEYIFPAITYQIKASGIYRLVSGEEKKQKEVYPFSEVLSFPTMPQIKNISLFLILLIVLYFLWVLPKIKKHKNTPVDEETQLLIKKN